MFVVTFSVAQTATDFTVDDCNGTSNNLYSELDAGNVIVLCWVMPCGPCATGAGYAQDAAQSFASSHPGIVKFYLVDDFANSDCSYLNGWAGSYQLYPESSFSNSIISMNDYGGPGMPKVVVIGPDKQVYYNVKNFFKKTKNSYGQQFYLIQFFADYLLKSFLLLIDSTLILHHLL